MASAKGNASWWERASGIGFIFFGNFLQGCLFQQHGGMLDDIKQRYSSRAARLYKNKIEKLANDAMRTYGTQVGLAGVIYGSLLACH